jgi:hypothetical protein
MPIFTTVSAANTHLTHRQEESQQSTMLGMNKIHHTRDLLSVTN